MDRDYSCAPPNWSVFYRKLCFVGPQALTGIDRKLVPALQLHARTGDGFWSDCYQELLVEYWDDPNLAVECVMDEFAHVVRREFLDPPLCWFGPRRGRAEGLDRHSHAEEVKRISFKLTPRRRQVLVDAAMSPFQLMP